MKQIALFLAWTNLFFTFTTLITLIWGKPSVLTYVNAFLNPIAAYATFRVYEAYKRQEELEAAEDKPTDKSEE